MEQNPAFLICWNYNDSRAGLPTREKNCETQGTAASKVPFMFMPGFDSISCYTVGSSALLLCAAAHGFGVTLGGSVLGKSRQPPRPLGLPFCAMCCRLRLDVPPVSLRLVSWPCAKNVAPLRRVACRGFPNPARNLRFLDLPLAAPCSPASSSALCANIARFFYALRRAGSGGR